MKTIKLTASTACLCVCGMLSLYLHGCATADVAEFLAPAGKPSDLYIHNIYAQTKLNQSDPANVVSMVQAPQYDLLSHSKRVIAAQGEKKRGNKTWFNLVAFDENGLLAKRKYLCIVDEKPKVLFKEPWEYLSFDCEAVLEGKILTQPYDSENTRRIGILKRLHQQFRDDMDEVKSDNKKLKTSGMMVNQAFETILVKLDSMPALAARLTAKDGVEFDHINLDKGKVGITLQDNIVAAKIRLGSIRGKFEQ